MPCILEFLSADAVMKVDVFTENSLVGLSVLLYVMEVSLEDSTLLELCPLWYSPSPACAPPITPLPLKSPYTTVKQHSARAALRAPSTDAPLQGLGLQSGQHIRDVLRRFYGDISRALGSFLQV